MRILCAIVEPTADLVPLGCNTDLVHRRRICPKPIGDDAARSPVFLHDPLEKLQRRGFVSLLAGCKGDLGSARTEGHKGAAMARSPSAKTALLLTCYAVSAYPFSKE